MVVKLLKYLFGYVIFEAKGGFCERFINLCAMRHIDIWDVSLSGDTIKAKIGINKFRKLRSIAKKTGAKISIVERRGLPFYLRNNYDRVGLLLGAGIFLFFMTIMNSFVWCIQSVDSEKFSREQILQAAEKAGLSYGIRVKNFDEEKAAREIYKAFEGELSWVKVNIKGSLAVVDFRDKVKKIEKDEKGEPSNIIANFDGVIISDETFQGRKNKSRGDTVISGDVLISGVVEGVDMKPLYYQAKGNFTALHTVSKELLIKDDTVFYKNQAIDESLSVIVFGLEIPLSFSGYTAENSKCLTYESYIEFEGYRLPFGIKKTVAVNHNKEDISDRNRGLIGLFYYSEYIYDSFKNTNILSYKVKTAKTSDGLKVSGEYQCIDFIGQSRAIIMENSENS